MGVIISFAAFEIDQENHQLRRDGAVLKLTGQPFKALLVLVQRPGQLVTREALQQAIWGDATVVDFEHGLNTCIRQVRIALGDTAESPCFIETVPRLGYRFIGDVAASPHARSKARRGRVAAAAAAVIALGVGVCLWRLSFPTRAPVITGVAQAHDLYLRGRVALDDPTAGTARTALQLFTDAIATDSRYAAAYAGVAQVYLQKPSSIPGVAPQAARSRALDAVRTSLALGGAVPESHLAAAELNMTDHDWSAAGREYRRAIELAPANSRARQEYALWLSYQARFQDALEQARIAESLDPLSPAARNGVAEVLRHARRFDEAILQSERTLQLNPNFGRAHAVLGHCYLAQGRFAEAIDEHRRSGNTGGNLGAAYAAAGHVSEARAILDNLKRQYASTGGGAGEIAQVYIGLHDVGNAFEWLSRAVDDGSVWTLQVAAVWDPLRGDSRFVDLLRRIGYGS